MISLRYLPAMHNGNLIAVSLYQNPKDGLWYNRHHFPYGGFSQGETFASKEGAILQGMDYQRQTEITL